MAGANILCQLIDQVTAALVTPYVMVWINDRQFRFKRSLLSQFRPIAEFGKGAG